MSAGPPLRATPERFAVPAPGPAHPLRTLKRGSSCLYLNCATGQPLKKTKYHPTVTLRRRTPFRPPGRRFRRLPKPSRRISPRNPAPFPAPPAGWTVPRRAPASPGVFPAPSSRPRGSRPRPPPVFRPLRPHPPLRPPAPRPRPFAPRTRATKCLRSPASRKPSLRAARPRNGAHERLVLQHMVASGRAPA